MQDLLLIIEDGRVSVFEKRDGKPCVVHINGESSYSLDTSDIPSSVKTLLEILVNEFNEDTPSVFAFKVLSGHNKKTAFDIMAAINGSGAETNAIDLDKTLGTVISRLSKDKKLMIGEYGVNYDGRSYRGGKNAVQSGDFDLLAYTIKSDKMAQYMDW